MIVLIRISGEKWYLNSEIKLEVLFNQKIDVYSVISGGYLQVSVINPHNQESSVTLYLKK
jgi:hypothetical protein